MALAISADRGFLDAVANRRGSAAVEFALVAPMFFVCGHPDCVLSAEANSKRPRSERGLS
jgi:TadE-like protein